MTVNSGVELTSDTLPGRLLSVLRVLTELPGLEYACPPEPLTGGFWAELVAFSLADPPPRWAGMLVARLMPDPDVAAKETIVQAGVAAAGFPTPAVRASGCPADGLGRAFMIMDRAPGRPLLADLAGVTAIAQGTRLLRRIPDALAVTMARLHLLDPEPVRRQLDAASCAGGSVDRLLEGQRQMATRYGRADLIRAAEWLADHQPVGGPDVICHGDLHPFNVLADGEHLTVLDWSSSLVGPRAHDVAFTSLLLSEPPLAVPRALQPGVRLLGRRMARRFLRSYQHHSGATPDSQDVQWHQALVCLRVLVELSGWAYEGHDHTGHPWLVSGPAFAARLTATTGVLVRAVTGKADDTPDAISEDTQ